MDTLAPDDWSGWRVLADQLTECGDERGVLLEMAHRQLTHGHHHQAPTTLEYEMDQQVALWLVMNRAQIGNEEVESVEIYGAWRKGFARLKPVAPPAIRTMMGWSQCQVLAASSLQGRSATTTVDAVIEAMAEWIDAVFDGVSPPGPDNRSLRQAEAADGHREVARQRGDSEGPWQQLPDRYLLENQWGLPHLDAQGLTFYLPAVMRFAVRHLRRPHPDDGWLSESLGFTIQRSSPPLRAYQRRRLARLTAAQRAAIAGFCWMTQNDSLERWVRAASYGDDWIEHFMK